MTDIVSGEVEDRELTPEEQEKDPTAAAVGKKGSKARANREPDKKSAGHRSCFLNELAKAKTAMNARHEAGWHVDGGAISQCHHRADTRDRH
jgi:hypothetical protein